MNNAAHAVTIAAATLLTLAHDGLITGRVRAASEAACDYGYDVDPTVAEAILWATEQTNSDTPSQQRAERFAGGEDAWLLVGQDAVDALARGLAKARAAKK